MIDLYSSATPNGRKITIMLEELGVKYNVIPISLDKKEQFSENFSKISPSNKIPVIVDHDSGISLFESWFFTAFMLALIPSINGLNNLIRDQTPPTTIAPTPR